ncbi:hypothetical protein [Plantactinospora sp. BC1]|uniref:hypothetical protein n=1 Tax=Plantactinospora sp. BC1 TaxID=2108470 RepID=UPI001F44C29B|nr:hypothetical protein [Plantactinospora sp. BC1]
MSYPPTPPPGMTLAASPYPVPLPPGWGALVISANRGPYLVSAPSSYRLKIDGRDVPGMAEGTFHIPVPAGEHDVRFTDLLGVPAMTTRVVVQPGTGHRLSFRFGGWRNRVYDGAGTDVTKFGMWSNYTLLLITSAVIGVVCCGGLGLLAMLDSSGPS